MLKAQIATIRAALGLLSQRDRRILLLVVVVQAALGLVDLVSISMLGLVVGVTASAVTGVPSPLFSSLNERFGLHGDPLTVAIALAAAAATLLMVKSVVSFFVTRRAFQFLANRQAIVAARLSAALLSKPLLFVHQRTSQTNSFALTSGAASATLGIVGQVVVIASELALLCVLAIGLAVIDPLVTGFTFIFFLIASLVVNRLVSKRAERLGATAAAADIASLSAIQEILRSYREVSVSGRRRLYVRRFQEMRWVAAGVQADLFITSQIPKYVFDLALILGGVVLVASQAATRGLAAGLSIIAIFYVAASRIVPSLMRLQGASIDMKSAKGSAKVTFDLAHELAYDGRAPFSNEADYAADLILIEKGLETGFMDFSGNIVVRNVSLSYPNAVAKALDGVSLSIPAGSSLAIVGPTGSGKSTLADLILGVLEPQEGEVLLDGVTPRDAIQQWPGVIGYVPQDIVVIDGTIRSNVAFGLPPELVDDERIHQVLASAQLLSFVLSERNGLETVVGEHGMKLSGGQRQRLGLARALYTYPKILMLDEATSALDAGTEAAVVNSVASLSYGVTRIVIAHRLATVRECDQVAFLEHGRLAACGSFDDVRRLSRNLDESARLLGL